MININKNYSLLQKIMVFLKKFMIVFNTDFTLDFGYQALKKAIKLFKYSIKYFEWAIINIIQK